MKILAVTNMYPTPKAPSFGTFIEQQIASLRLIGVEVDVWFLDRVGSGRRVYRGLGHRLQGRIRAGGHDLVHVHYGGLMAERISGADAVPIVVSFCGSDLLGAPRSHPLRAARAYAGVLASRRAARAADGIVVKSTQLRAALPPGLDPQRIRVVPNGIDLDRFVPLDRLTCRQELGWDESGFRVLFCSTSKSPVKRPELAERAVGIARRHGLDARLVWLEGVAHDKVPLWLNACDAVLLTSAHEGSPNIIKEALACNVPIVSVDAGDVAERIRGIDGCHLAEDAPGALGEALVAVAHGAGRVDGRSAVAELGLERVAASLVQFYEEILDRTKRGSSEARCNRLP
jgi:teichuronic acid biosynthesis glycosyltransferase TuaC